MKTEEKLDFEKVWLMFQETNKQLKELTLSTKELRINSKETDKQLKELGKQIGGLGNKFGTYTEGLAFPSVVKVLTEKFKVENIFANFRNKTKDIEIDVLGYSNSNVNEVYVVEIKSNLRIEDINQMLNLLNKFKEIFPEHADKKVYGILASVTTNEQLKRKLNDLGIYHAQSGADIFKIDSPKNFKPKAY